jgi:fructose-1,6-bisphosphatase/inositol monophosphatase family enzyme
MVDASEKIHDMTSVARQVGTTAREMRASPGTLGVEYKIDSSVVSLADSKAEGIIKEVLLKKYGGGFIGEETGKTASADSSNLTWIVDPIDGTTNFTAGAENFPSDPNWGVSIACKTGDKVTQGVVYFPETDQLYWAENGKGAHVIDRDGKEHVLKLDDKVRQKTSMELAGGFIEGNSEQIKSAMGNAYKAATGGEAETLAA